MMPPIDRDELATLIVTSWPRTPRSLSADVWADELERIDAPREAVELAVRRLRAHMSEPPAISDLRAEIARSSSAPPSRRHPTEEPAISLTEYLRRVRETDGAARADELEGRLRRFSKIVGGA